jgi:hypothetical protein
MATWHGPRTLTVVTACLNPAGAPDFALSEVEVTYEEYVEGRHCDRVEQRLVAAGYEEPYLHYDDLDDPPFLVAAVRHYLGRAAPKPTTTNKEGSA